MSQEIKQTNTGSNKEAGNHQQPFEQPAAVNRPRRSAIIPALLWLFVALGGGYAIWYTSAAFIEPATRMTFIMGSALNLAIFLAIVAQAWIYWGQRNLMQKQWEAMSKALEQNERLATEQRSDAMLQIRIMVGQAEIMQQSLQNSFIQTQGTQGQLDVMHANENTLKRQAKAFEAQVDVMNGQLEAMRRQQDQNERAIKAAEDGVAVSREAFYVGEAPYFGATKIVFRWAITTVKNTGTGPVQRETGQPELIITFMNGGKTPAWHFLCTPHLELRERAGEEGKYFTLDAVHDRECPDAENSFYPSGAQKCIKYRGRGEFSDTEIEAIKGRPQTLFLIIDLGYTDMRNKRETRNWIRQLNPTTGRFGDGGARQS